MTTLTLANARIPGRTGGGFDVEVTDGIVGEIRPQGSGKVQGRRVDLAGRWLLPGFWDEHVHFALWAVHSRRLDLGQAASAGEAADKVAEAARLKDDAEPLVAVGFRDALWPDAPHRDLLDRAAGSREVYALSGDLHSAWLNSAALRRVGQADHPTGLLREADCFAVEDAVTELAAARADEWIAAAARDAAARGVIGIVDLGMGWMPDEARRHRAQGVDMVRVECGFYPPDLDQAIAQGVRTGEPIDGDGLVRMGPFKVIVDGSLNTRTAWCFDAYPGLDGPEAFGLATVDFDELEDQMRRAGAAGLTPAIHAIGDHAVARVLDAFEAVGCSGRMEHAQLVRWADIDRFARAHVTASVQPEHAMDDRDVADHHWAGRTDRAFPLATMLRAGVRLAFGSDAPVAILDPWVTLAAAVTRSRDGRDPWHPEQAISVPDAIAASARGHATVERGMVADLQIVERDPLTCDPETLRTMPVAGTLLDGRVIGFEG
jgi:predicted amidohydrolase YtcJ